MNGATLWKKRVFLLDDIAAAMEFVTWVKNISWALDALSRFARAHDFGLNKSWWFENDK